MRRYRRGRYCLEEPAERDDDREQWPVDEDGRDHSCYFRPAKDDGTGAGETGILGRTR